MSKRIRVHFIGIGGSGMYPLARLAALSDDPVYEISGSDRGASPETLAAMRRRGWRVFGEHDADHVSDANVVVYSSAIPVDHPERAGAAERARVGHGVLEHRMDFLMRLVARCPVQLAVAGTHGKTSTASLLGWMLTELGFDPDIIVGGRPAYLPEGVRRGAGRVAVYETDESDGSFLRATAGLRLVLNIDRDHLEHYGDMDGLIRAFREFAAGGATTVLNASDPVVKDTFFDDGRSSESSAGRRIAYHADEVEHPAALAKVFAGRFDGASDRLVLTHELDEVAPGGDAIHLPLPGRHFASNALGALGLVRCMLDLPAMSDHGDIPTKRILEVMNRFPGVERRLELLGRPDGVAVYDDYGHHPTEIRAVLAALRGRLAGAGRLIAVFQPHRYSRTQALYAEFAAALTVDADRVFVLPIYSAGEAAREGVSAALIRDAATASGKSVELIDRDDWAGVFRGCAPGDVVVCLGAGDISASIRAFVSGRG